MEVEMGNFFRWSTGQIWRFLIFLGRQIARGVHWGLHNVRARLPIAIWALLCLILATVVVRLTFSFFGNIEWRMVGLVAVVLVVVVLITWLLRNPARRDYAGRAARSGWFWWPVATLITLVLIVVAIRYFTRPAPGTTIAIATTFTVVAEKEKWTETYHFPPAMTVEWRAMNPNGHFAMKTQDGTIYNFTPEKSDVIVGVVAEASFMALGESSENIRIRLYR